MTAIYSPLAVTRLCLWTTDWLPGSEVRLVPLDVNICMIIEVLDHINIVLKLPVSTCIQNNHQMCCKVQTYISVINKTVHCRNTQ